MKTDEIEKKRKRNLILLFQTAKLNSYIFLGVFTGWRGRHTPSLFLQALVFFRNNLEELKTMLSEVELTTNNAPLTYAYPNTIETCYLLLTLYSIICNLADNYYIVLTQHQL